MSAGIFGPSLDGADVEAATIAFLEYWMPTYVPQQRRHRDPDGERWPDGIEGINSYTTTVEELAATKYPEDQLPAIVVASPGEDADPRIEGNGRTTSYFRLAVIAIAEGGGDDPTEDAGLLARVFAGAARQAISQHPDLKSDLYPDGFSNAVTLKPGRNDVIARGVDARRNLAACAYPFVLEVAGVLDVLEGPGEPLSDPENPPAGRQKITKGSIDVRPGPDRVDELRENGFFGDD